MDSKIVDCTHMVRRMREIDPNMLLEVYILKDYEYPSTHKIVDKFYFNLCNLCKLDTTNPLDSLKTYGYNINKVDKIVLSFINDLNNFFMNELSIEVKYIKVIKMISAKETDLKVEVEYEN